MEFKKVTSPNGLPGQNEYSSWILIYEIDRTEKPLHVHKSFSGVHVSISLDIQYISVMLDKNAEYSHQNRQQNLLFIILPNCVFVAYLLSVISLFE